MTKKTAFIILSFLFSFIISSWGQDSSLYLIGFYNVENLFHPQCDTVNRDKSFTPGGSHKWTYKRYFTKINRIAKVILAMGKSSPPDLMGLAEIESKEVLYDLCYRSPLKKYQYRFVHYDSPDHRGIEVALLYRPDRLTVLHEEVIPVTFPFDPDSRNRDILLVSALFPNGDTLFLFINHWTSRYGGLAATLPKRNYYAQTLREKTDSLFAVHPSFSIFIMGDFNDYPEDESLKEILRANPLHGSIETKRLYNLMSTIPDFRNQGTHKYEDFWGCLDQIIVSGNLLKKGSSLKVRNQEAVIFSENFMLENDRKYGGDKPFRTYLGPRYIGGYSDHLPVMVYLMTVQ